MADITLRLIWYKLGEVGGKMAEAGRSWYTELDFDSYVLDLLLLGWCALCVVVILAVNAIVSAFGPLQKQPQAWGRERDTAGSSTSTAALHSESCQWFNSALNWFYLHYYHAPDFVDDWIKSLNEQLGKLGGPVQARFDRIQSGSLPPKFTHVSSEASPEDKFIIHAKLETRDLAFVVFASQQTHEGVKLTNCIANVLRLRGTLRVKAYREGGDVNVTVNFEGQPDIKVTVKPMNPYQEPSELVDLGVLEANVRNSISLSSTTFRITHLLMPGDLHAMRARTEMANKQEQSQGQGHDFIPPPAQESFLSPSVQSMASQQPPLGSSSAPLRASPQRAAPIHSVSVQSEPVQSIPIHAVRQQQQQQQQKMQQQQQQQIQQQYQQQQFAAPPQQQQQPVQRRDQQRVRPQSRPEGGMFEPVETLQFQPSVPLHAGPPKPPRMVGDKRLLVKVIKANGLSIREAGSANAVCMISTDDPVQGYATSVVKNTLNPFWDEHFLFDITRDTQDVKVEVYDKGKPEGDDFIGEATVYVEDLRKTPSSRQILRLHPDPGNFEYNTGTVTAEFLFMDPAEADLLLDSMATTASNQLSPRRRVEIARNRTAAMTGSPNFVDKQGYPDESPRYSQAESPTSASSGGRFQQIPTIESSPTQDTTDASHPHPADRPYTQTPEKGPQF